jgi:sugar phosphate isomerase/epimerase
MKNLLLLSLALGLIIIANPVPAQKNIVKNIFYAQNTLNGFTNTPKTALEKAKLLKSFGYDGLEGFGYKGFFELKDALDKEGLSMPVNYVGLGFGADGKLGDTLAIEIKEMIRATSKGDIIYFHLSSNSFKEVSETGDASVSSILRELSDYAAPYGVKLCAYPHINTYCETVAHSVKLAKMVDRKNYGASLNLCHLLKVEGAEGIDDKLKEFTPFLFAVNICGADDGDTRQMGWDRLIQPLGQGSFDTYHFIKVLLDNGYNGPVGLQCYNLKGDIVMTLSKSLQTWNDYKKRYLEEKE